MNKSILKNSAWLFGAQSIVKIISFFYTVFLAGSLGVTNFGFYVAALTYFTLISALADFGFNRYLIREGARNPDKLSILVSTIALIRFLAMTIIWLVFSLFLFWLDPDSMRVNLSILAVLAILPQSLALTFDAALVARQNLRASAVALLSLSLSTTILGIYLISSGKGAFGGVLALVFGHIVYLMLLVAVNLRNQLRLFFQFNLKEIRQIIKGSLPYGLLGVLGLVYFRVDTLLLSYLKGAEQTGFYGAAYRFLEAIVFVPSALATAMFPVLAKLHDNDHRQIKKLYFSSLKILGLLSIPILVGYLTVLPNIIRYFLPNYLQSIDALMILSLAIPFIFLHTPGALVLISGEKYLKEVIFLSVVMLSFNVILNLFLIPPLGFIGASWVTVLSEATSFVVFFILLYQKVLKNA